ncbi:MAG TPA: prepilin peptidase [Candidatus Saccharimonadales bacterium]|nr:prepilin peptidase [Candidatus Saccharimonadales bacterium]
MIVIALVLAWLGLCAGSFVNALVWRLHEQQAGKTANGKQKKATSNLSILKGRSMCPDCKHTLAWYDLIPLFSWLALGRKCRYCKKTISVQYPLVELIAGLVFAGSYLLWPLSVHIDGQWLLLSMWLAAAVGLLALAVYDLRWMLLPNRIIYPTLFVAATGRAGYIVFFDNRPLRAVGLWMASILVASGVFYLLYMASQGKWIGFGDVRLGLITGTLLAKPQYSLLMIFIASVLGSLVAMPDLIRRKKTLASRLPYGPFLIAATLIVMLWGESLLNHYKTWMGIN